MCIPRRAHNAPMQYRTQAKRKFPSGFEPPLPVDLSAYTTNATNILDVIGTSSLDLESAEIPSSATPNCTNDFQLSLRREKSRIAAKARRQKENQALVKLRLSVPIRRIPSSIAGVCSATDNLPNPCALYAAPNYRTASIILRQQHLTAQPEFEKSVTIRLAGSALCLYNLLYPNATTAVQPWDNMGPLPISSGHVSLSLLSQSLMAVLVDAIEETIVYASPSYSEFIGLPWNSIIGLNMSEVRWRQTCTTTQHTVSSQYVISKWSKTNYNRHSFRIKSAANLRPTTTNHHSGYESFPLSLLPIMHNHLRETGVPSLLWSVTPGDKPLLLTNLLPLDDTISPGHPDEADVSLNKHKSSVSGLINEHQHIRSVCWANTLVCHSPINSCLQHSTILTSSTATTNEKHTFSAVSSSFSSLVSPLQASSVYLYLLSPIVLPHADLPFGRLHTKFTAPSSSSSSCSSPPSPPPPDFNAAGDNWSRQPRSYHHSNKLYFISAQDNFLTALDYSSVCNLSSYSLLDLVHSEDLAIVAEALNSVTKTQPVISTLHRLRSASGFYRWSRFLGFFTPHTDTVTTNAAKVETLSLRRSSSSPHPSINSIKDWILVCCHQFGHLASDRPGLSYVRSDEMECNKVFGCRQVQSRRSPIGEFAVQSISDPYHHNIYVTSERPMSVDYPYNKSTVLGSSIGSYNQTSTTYPPSYLSPSDDHLSTLDNLSAHGLSELDVASGVELAAAAAAESAISLTSPADDHHAHELRKLLPPYMKSEDLGCNSADKMAEKTDWAKRTPSTNPNFQFSDTFTSQLVSFKLSSSSSSSGSDNSTPSMSSTTPSDFSNHYPLSNCSGGLTPTDYDVSPPTQGGGGGSDLRGKHSLSNTMVDSICYPYDCTTEQLLPQAEIFPLFNRQTSNGDQLNYHPLYCCVKRARAANDSPGSIHAAAAADTHILQPQQPTPIPFDCLALNQHHHQQPAVNFNEYY